MAAMRSALAMLGRRGCSSSGSSAAVSMAGRGMEIHQVFCPAPPPLRPVAVRNLESCRRFSSRGGEPKHTDESFARILWKWAKYRLENVEPVTKSKLVHGYGLVVVGSPTLYVLHEAKKYV